MRSFFLPAAFLCILTAAPALAAPSVQVRMVFQVHGADPVLVAKTAQVIRHRLADFGADDPEVSVQGDRVSVGVWDVEDVELRGRLRRLLLANATIGLHLIHFPAAVATAASSDEILENYHGQLPADLEILAGERRSGEKRSTVYYAVEKQPIITSDDFASARPGVGQFAQPILAFRLRPDAAARFAKATGDNVGSGLAIVLNGQVLSAPKINSRISDSGQIEGGFTEGEVQDLAILLRSGSLPAEITLVEEKAVAATRHGLRRPQRMLLFMGGALLGLSLMVTLVVYLVLYLRERRAR